MYLGSGTDFSGLTLDPAIGRWLGVKVGTDNEMTPRYLLTGSLYARRALDADLLGGLGPGAFAAAAHVHDASHVTSGMLAAPRGGTGVSGSGGTNHFLRADGLGGWASGLILAGDLPAGGGAYIQNQTAAPQSAGFSISGSGTVGALTVNGNVMLGATMMDTVTINGTIQGMTPLVFEGATSNGIVTAFAITDPTAPRTITFPDATGTVVTTGNLSDITAVGTIGIGTWKGSAIGVTFGGTGATAAGESGSIAYSTGAAYAFSDPGTIGQVLLSGGTGAPRWASANAHTHSADEITSGAFPVARGGTGTASVGSAGSVNYSTGTAHAYSSVGTAGQLLHSGGSGSPTWAAVNLASATQTTGILTAGSGGTGLSASGGAGQYLRGNGAGAWTSSAILAGDLPATGTPYVRKNAADTSTASANGFLYAFTNNSIAAGSGALNGIVDAAATGPGSYYGLRGDARVDNNTQSGGRVTNHGLYGYAEGTTLTAGQTTDNYGVLGIARGLPGAGQSNNTGVYGLADSSQTGNMGVGGVANGATAGTNIGVWGYAANGGTNWAGRFDGAVAINGDAVIGNDATNTLTVKAAPILLANATSSADALILGGDTNLYRASANTLRTDDALHVQGQLTTGPNAIKPPIAYAYIKMNGAIAVGSPNVSAAWNATSKNYEVQIAGVTYQDDQYVTIVTSATGVDSFVTGSAGGKLLVVFWQSSNGNVQANFKFVIFKP